ncbi:hypothetical protein J6590_001719, partial [Homalodisca vitripennis]
DSHTVPQCKATELPANSSTMSTNNQRRMLTHVYPLVLTLQYAALQSPGRQGTGERLTFD